MLAVLLRGILGGTAARGAMGGGLSGFVRSAAKRFGQAAAQGETAGAGQAAAKPQINYGGLVSKMGDPLAYQEEAKRVRRDTHQQRVQEHRAEQHRATPLGRAQGVADGAAEAAESLGGIVANATGVTDGLDGISKLLHGDVTGALKSFTTSTLKVVTSVVTLPLAIKAWSESLVESRREMSRFDGRSAGAFARLDARKTMLDIHSGQARGETTAGLANAVADLREEIRPIEDLLANMTNGIGTIATRFAQGLAVVTKMLPLVSSLVENTKKKPDESQLPLDILLGRIGNPAPNVPGFREEARPPLPPLKRR